MSIMRFRYNNAIDEGSVYRYSDQLSTLPASSVDDSRRIPAAFLPEINTSFGHLHVTAAPGGSVSEIASATARAATNVSCIVSRGDRRGRSNSEK